MKRRETRKVYYGAVQVGGGSPVSIQSMSTRKAADSGAVLNELASLAAAGCEIARVAVKDQRDAEAINKICSESPIPVVADVHFNYRLAVLAAGNGAAGLRINPGNIGGAEKVRKVAAAAAEAGIPVRVGVNSGSLEKDLAPLYRKAPARALCQSAVRAKELMEDTGFGDLVFSIKSSDPMINLESNRLFAADNDYPLHIGVTEAGPALSGAVRSAASLALLLCEGIGDTLRISLSADPVEEVVAAAALLSALGLREDIPRVVSCPTCGRCHIDVQGIAAEVERRVLSAGKGITVAVMGCEVNGPGEAAEADVGIAGTAAGAVLFRKGRKLGPVSGDLLQALLAEIDKLG
ncbi:MAG: flavodoxin-dependent (E)-4-hydroxy-3-methylbut-2-enyl-diphosphate synthase [Candidatus Latescibacteria bacterium]|nr:flavodoxin-dependent (E)-4-hydroxy-3-methylbut-2-enyl-diphosphate synthase [bacterium]MBD3425573.1 flavodoxin-dependent (E)-4-hydroxy-3-methylbut-2-enyl-diphosphate synthase [Candidatus Latescibacterota bacterium]